MNHESFDDYATKPVTLFANVVTDPAQAASFVTTPVQSGKTNESAVINIPDNKGKTTRFDQANNKQWFFLYLISIWLFAAMILPFIAFCLTKNPISLSFFGTLLPPTVILYRITRHLFPLGDNDIKIALAKWYFKRRVL